MKSVLLLTIFMLLGNTAFAIEDTIENRSSQAERYFDVSSLKEELQNVINELAKNQPPGKREQFKEIFTKYLDLKTVLKIQKEAMTRTFTADEIAYLVDVENSEMAKAVNKKMAKYLAEIQPDMQAETMKAISKANREMEDCKQSDETEGGSTPVQQSPNNLLEPFTKK